MSNASKTLKQLQQRLTESELPNRRELEALLNSIEAQLDEQNQKFRKLTESQAEAIVNSASIIAELEETRERLELARSEAELATNEALVLSSFGDILEHSLNEIFIFDRETLKFLHVNHGAQANTGYTMEELRELTPLDIKPEFTQEQFEALIAPLLRGEVANLDFTTVHQRRDGTQYPVQVHLEKSNYRTHPVLVAIILDISMQREAENSLRLLSEAVEQSPASVVITDSAGRIEYANSMFKERTSTSIEESYGNKPGFLQRRGHAGNEFETLWRTITSGKIWRGEFHSENDDGKASWESASVSPVRNADGTITHYLAVLQDITEHKMLLSQMQDLAYRDTLTGLPNRHSILRCIQQAIDGDRHNKFALLFLDFDRFKLINDSLGHEAGDELLRQISERLHANVRSSDGVMPARLGGDEFVVLLPNLSCWSDAVAIAERLLRAFDQSYQIGGHTVHSTASIGIVTNEQAYHSASDMLRDADLAMYAAKSAGRSCHQVFNHTMHTRVQERLRIECDLRDAVAREEFRMFYQPIVSIDSGELEGVEALIRWIHPEQGVISPDKFIPIAEETGLIVPLGNWILDEVCRQISRWQDTLGDAGPSCVHVNMSRLQMIRPDVVDVVKQAITRHDLDPSHLHLEVTESVIMHNPETIVAAITELRKFGIKVDMDDFGTGYSSLSCLHEFPIDVLKVDRSFIDDESRARDYIALLHAIITLADNLGVQVIAEGVETSEQLATLQALGCEFAQGYFFSKPVCASDLEHYVKTRTIRPPLPAPAPLTSRPFDPTCPNPLLSRGE